MKRAISWLKQLFNRVAYHDDGHAKTYTRGKDGVYRRQIDWHSLLVSSAWAIGGLIIGILLIKLALLMIALFLCLMGIAWIAYEIIKINTLRKRGDSHGEN